MGMNERLENIEKLLSEPKKKKLFRLPTKAKVSNMKMKDGFATVMVIKENKNVDFVKERIIDGTIKLEDTFHAVAPKDVFFYKGKPLMIQYKSKLNPYNPTSDKHETYGQKWVMAKMMGDKLSFKKKIGLGMSIGLIIIIGIVIYALIAG